MAYLDLNASDLSFTIGRSLAPTVDRSALSNIDRAAVMLARFDSAATLHAAGRLRTMASRVFGLPKRNGLADPRLEALRRFAVAVAHDSPASIARERSQLQTFGYAEEQISRAQSIAARFRPKARASNGAITAVLFAIGLALGTWLLKRYFDDPMVSFVTVMTISLPIWTTVARG
jgi:hypothetical protein